MPDDAPKRRHFDPQAPEGLVRPVSEAPHARFFEDGEEPPDRYDLDDPLEYVLPRQYQLDSRRYFQVAGRRYRQARRELVRTGLTYWVCAFLGFNCVGWIYLIGIHPGLRAGLISHSLSVLTGNSRRYGGLTTPFKSSLGRLIVCDLPLTATQMGGFFAVYVAAVVALISGEIWSLAVAVAVMVFVPFAIAVLAVRVCGFAAELVLDHRFDAVQAIRGSWLLSRKHFWGLLWLKLRLVLLEWAVGVFTLGIGLIWVIPYTTLVWTTAYLDIAGSEEVMEDAEPLPPAVDEPAPRPAEPDANGG